jgi:hypothetical protein
MGDADSKFSDWIPAGTRGTPFLDRNRMDSGLCRIAVLLRTISGRDAACSDMEYIGRLVVCSDHGHPLR